MKTILYVNPTAIHGGAEEALLGIMRAAKNLGYIPVLVVPRTGWLTQKCEERSIAYEVLPTLPETIETEDWVAQIKTLPANALAILRLIQQHRAVLVHSNTPRASYHAGLAARIAGVHTVTHCHDIVGSPFLSSSKARLLSYLCDKLIAVSDAVRQSILDHSEHLRNKTTVMFNGLDRSTYDPVIGTDLHKAFGVPKDAAVFGTTGAIRYWKGQDILIEAFCQIQNRLPNSYLLIVGDAQGSREQEMFKHQLHEQVRQLDLQDKVIFTGWRDDVWSLMKSMTVFVHVPTQPDPLPTAVIHACGLGCAIIGSQIGGVPEILEQGNAGLLVPAKDPSALSNALYKLVSNSALLDNLRAKAQQQFVKTFTFDQMQMQLHAVYQQVLS